MATRGTMRRHPNAIDAKEAARAPAVLPATENSPMNAEYIATFEAALNAMPGHEKLEGVIELGPQSVADGGHTAPFTQAALTQCMNRGEEHEGTANLLWHALEWRPQKDIPYNVKGIEDLKNHSYRDPPTSITRIVVHVLVEGTAADFMKNKGQWKRISPEEPVHAKVFGCAEYFALDPKQQSEEVTAKWITAIRNTNYVFHSITDIWIFFGNYIWKLFPH